MCLYILQVKQVPLYWDFTQRAFSSSLDVFGIDCLLIGSKFSESLSQILSIVICLSLSSNLSYRISTMVWYSSGKFDSMWVIIYESSMCTLSFCRSPLSSSMWVIRSSGFLVTSSSPHLENLFHIIFLEAPVVGSKFHPRLSCISVLIEFCLCLFNDLKANRVFLCE